MKKKISEVFNEIEKQRPQENLAKERQNCRINNRQNRERCFDEVQRSLNDEIDVLFESKNKLIHLHESLKEKLKISQTRLEDLMMRIEIKNNSIDIDDHQCDSLRKNINLKNFYI